MSYDVIRSATKYVKRISGQSEWRLEHLYTFGIVSVQAHKIILLQFCLCPGGVKCSPINAPGMGRFQLFDLMSYTYSYWLGFGLGLGLGFGIGWGLHEGLLSRLWLGLVKC